MSDTVKSFEAGVRFESNTTYLGDKAEYHIYPRDAMGSLDPWYTLIQEGDPELLAAFILRDLENVTIDLAGAKLVFHGRIMPFYAYNCKNLTLKNFSVDYDRPFYTQGLVADADEGSVTLDIPEMFRYRVENRGLIAESDLWENNLNHGALLFQPYNATSIALSETSPFVLGVIGETVARQPNPPCEIYQLLAEQLSGRRVRLAGFPDFFRPKAGEILAFTHENRHKTGFQIENCADVTVENIRLLHISALAMILNLCHNVTIRNFSSYVDEQCEGRIVCVNADVIHGFHVTGRVLVEDCRFENMLDDAFNIHGNYTVCEKSFNARSFQVINKSAGLRHGAMYLPGDTIYVYRGRTQEFKAAYTVTEANYLPGELVRQRISVREPLCDFQPDDIVESRRMPEITIRRCVSGRARGGYRISSGKRVVMEDCRLENTPIMFTGDTNYWYENSPVRDVEIRNCEFEHFTSCTPVTSQPIFTATEAAPYYHSGIKLIGNRFVDCRGGLVNMSRTRGIEMRGNGVCNAPEGAGDMRFRDCADVSISQ